MQNWLTCLDHFKDIISESTTTNDRFFETLISSATADIESYTGRKLRERTYGANGLEAEYQDGAGEKFLYTYQKPIISVTSLYDDIDNNYTSSYLFASTDYHIFKELGKILLLSDASLGTVFSVGRANIKNIYTAGYGEFEIIDERNNYLDFVEVTNEISAEITAGVYTASGLCTAMKTALDLAGGDTYTVTYNYQTSKFKISSDGDLFTIKWSSGTNAIKSIGKSIGFDISADDSAATNYTADTGVLGIPDDLERACLLLCQRSLYESVKGRDRFDKNGETQNVDGASVVRYNNPKIPPEVERILDRYTRVVI